MKKSIIITLILLLLINTSCTATTPETTPENTFARGADIGWLDQMEATGFKFYTKTGEESDCMQILKDNGINSLRFRVWVNPSNDPQTGHCSKEEVGKMCLRAKNLGFKIMINFHYSDSWADPGQQTKPAAWANYSFIELTKAVYDHTFEVLSYLKELGITPEWVQVGNEIPNGMLWPDGSLTNNDFTNLSILLNSGYDAVKAVDSSMKVIVHIDKGNDINKSEWFYKGITAKNTKYDMIGLSYYPYWLEPIGQKDYKESIGDLETNIKQLNSKYNKPVMLVEIGGHDEYALETYNMLSDVIKLCQASGSPGVFYWEPQGARVWSKYALNCWQNDGKPSIAIEAFKP